METEAGTVRRLVSLLAVALAVAGCSSPQHRTTETAAALGTSDWPVLGESKPVLGVDLYAPDNYPAAQVEADGQRTLAYIKDVLKADAVGIVWNFYAPTPYSNVVQATGATLSASNVAILTRIAAQDHLLVEYRPLIMVPSAQNHWEGLINPYPPASWFSSYYNAELPYLRIAQQLDVREFVTGSELYDLNSSPFWPSFFARVSQIYHGVISYAVWDGNYFGSPPGTSFQAAAPELLPAKYVGMDMYWHMNLPPNATTAEVTTAWEALYGKVPQSVLRRTAIDETGIQARAGAYSDPEDLNAPGRWNEQVQVNWFTAACATVRQYHMRGVFFFKVDLTDNPAYPATSLSTFEGRKGAAAISECIRILQLPHHATTSWSQDSVRSRLVILVAVLTAAAAVGVTITRLASPPSGPGAARVSLPTAPASYLGVYETGPPHTYQPVAKFTRVVGMQPNLVGYYSGWGEPFQTLFAETVRSHGAVTILQMDPTYASVPEITAGGYDRYLRSFADSVRDFGQAVVIGFGHEMNAPWYSWGFGHVPPSTFVEAWRHIVTLFRAEGADNVTWLWTLQADEAGTGPIASWWPGAAYVTWVGIDGYYYRPSDTFASVFGRTIVQVRAFTSKPMLLSETAVGPNAGQPAKIADLFAGMRQYGMLGLVWFDIEQNSGIYHQDWHLEDSPQAETAFQRGASALTLAHL